MANCGIAGKDLLCWDVDELESRHMLAGNVDLQVSGESVRLTGDDASNHVRMYRIGGLVWSVNGEAGTTINGRASEQVIVRGDLKISLRGGDDVVALGRDSGVQSTVGGDLRIDLGSGNNSLSVTNVGVADDANIRSSGRLVASMTRVDVGDDLRVRTGNAVDEIQLYRLNVKDDVTIATRGGADRIDAFAVSIQDDLRISLGQGDDYLRGWGIVRDSLRIREGAGVNNVSFDEL